MWVVNATTRAALPTGKGTGMHCTGGLVGGLDGRTNSRLHQDSILGPSTTERVAIPTTLSRPNKSNNTNNHVGGAWLCMRARLWVLVQCSLNTCDYCLKHYGIRFNTRNTAKIHRSRHMRTDSYPQPIQSCSHHRPFLNCF